MVFGVEAIPQSGGFGVENVLRPTGCGPGAQTNFVFELARTPAGVTQVDAEFGERHFVADGLFEEGFAHDGVDIGDDVFGGVRFVGCAEQGLDRFFRDRPAIEYRVVRAVHLGKGFGDGEVHRAVEDDAHNLAAWFVAGDEDDGVGEVGVGEFFAGDQNRARSEWGNWGRLCGGVSEAD